MREAVRRHANAATVIAVVALVLGMSGGAWAAGKYLITSTKQIKPNVLKELKGVAGAKGAQGVAGGTGPQGPAGPGGAAGKEGAVGAAGKEGAAGKDGKEGKEGKAGQTGFTETLPSEKTETGTWAVNLFAAATEEFAVAPISFSIPLSAEGAAFYLNATETAGKAKTGGCAGSAAEPTAPKGELCIYTEAEENEELSATPHATFNETPGHFGKPGTFLEFNVKGGGQVAARGSWAVTG
jgi:hypothetical protein